tara:strand:- start:2310 stop:2807 length:498 start_codon:yes stop_codon:yes gene_type:complete
MTEKSKLNKNHLTHFDADGKAQMVNIGEKNKTHRIAIASGFILMKKTTFKKILSGNTSKGDVLGISRIAAIMAAKKTSELIPLCHPLEITKINVEFKKNEIKSNIQCITSIETYGKTGVEMEALTAVQVALLTIYDMCKAIDKGMTITNVKLNEKHGGKSGSWIF